MERSPLPLPGGARRHSRAVAAFGTDSDGATLFERMFPPRRSGSGAQAATAADLAALTSTDVAQPALAAVEAAGIALWQQFDAPCDAAVGHSFGELSALYAAGAINEAALHNLAKTRGAAMAACAAADEAGVMLAALTSPTIILETLGNYRLT